MRRWALIGASYVGAVVGAGFGSGREILQFFAAFGAAGILGAAMAGGLFAWSGVSVLRRAAAGGHHHHGELLRDICGPVLGAGFDHVLTAFLLLTVSAVLAAGGALAHHWGGSTWAGAIGLALALLGTQALGRRGHVLASALLLPVLALTAGWGAWHALDQHGARALAALQPVGGAGAGGWLPSAVLYVGYNLALALAGLCAARREGDRLPDLVWGGAAGGIVLGLLCGASVVAILGVRGAAAVTDLPMALTLPAHPAARLLFASGLAGALWTTGTASLSALQLRVPARAAWLGAGAWIGLALPGAAAGLSWLVGVLYPLMGYAGLPLLLCLLVRGFARPGTGRGAPGTASP